MYFKLSLFAVICSYLACQCAAAEGYKPIVGVYYETYCPDSIKFITTQLYPAYLKLNSSYFVPHFVPFGNGNWTTNQTTGVTTFQCQHSEKECHGNKVHACVLHLALPTLQDKFKFINCTLAKTNTSAISSVYPTEECAKESNLSYIDITTCFNNLTLSSNLLMVYGNETKAVNISGVPFVTIDGKSDKAQSDKFVANFNTAFCENVVKPGDTSADALCKSPNNSASFATLTVLPVIFFSFLFSKMY